VPLPKPLKKTAPKKKKNAVMKQTMHELKNSGTKRPLKQRIAIGLKQSGQSNKKKKKK